MLRLVTSLLVGCALAFPVLASQKDFGSREAGPEEASWAARAMTERDLDLLYRLIRQTIASAFGQPGEQRQEEGEALRLSEEPDRRAYAPRR